MGIPGGRPTTSIFGLYYLPAGLVEVRMPVPSPSAASSTFTAGSAAHLAAMQTQRCEYQTQYRDVEKAVRAADEEGHNTKEAVSSKTISG
jgi:hypothetical protein